MESCRNSNQIESQTNVTTFVNTMAYDPDDSEYVNSDNEDPENNSWDRKCSGSSSGVESIDNEDLFNETQILKFPNKSGNRRISEISGKVMVQNKRKHGLVEIREQIQGISHQSTINNGQLQTLLSNRNFNMILFNLFDDNGLGILDQPAWFGKLKYWSNVSNEFNLNFILILLFPG